MRHAQASTPHTPHTTRLPGRGGGISWVLSIQQGRDSGDDEKPKTNRGLIIRLFIRPFRPWERAELLTTAAVPATATLVLRRYKVKKHDLGNRLLRP